MIFERTQQTEIVPFVEMTAGYSVTIRNFRDKNGNADPSDENEDTDNDAELSGANDPTEEDDDQDDIG